jgi:Arc/MetJ-type ribon-helix-helix transcriptional regulator
MAPMPPKSSREFKMTTVRLPVEFFSIMDQLVDLGLYRSKNQIFVEALEDLFYNIALGIELRYLAEKKAKELGIEGKISPAVLLQVMGEIMKERAEDFTKPDPTMDKLGQIIKLDPEKAYQTALKIKEVLKK